MPWREFGPPEARDGVWEDVEVAGGEAPVGLCLQQVAKRIGLHRPQHGDREVLDPVRLLTLAIHDVGVAAECFEPELLAATAVSLRPPS